MWLKFSLMAIKPGVHGVQRGMRRGGYWARSRTAAPNAEEVSFLTFITGTTGVVIGMLGIDPYAPEPADAWAPSGAEAEEPRAAEAASPYISQTQTTCRPGTLP